MLTPEQRNEIQTRLHLDRIEARSEQAQEAGDQQFSIKFNEATRVGLIDLLKFLTRPARELIQEGEQRDQSRFAKLQEVFRQIRDAGIIELTCAAIENFNIKSNSETIISVYIRENSGKIHEICQVVTDAYWYECLEKLNEEFAPEEYDLRKSKIQELIDQVVSKSWVSVACNDLKPAVIDYALKTWIEEFFPDLHDLQLNWLKGTELENFQRTATGLSIAKGFATKPEGLDNLLNNFESDLIHRLRNEEPEDF